MCPIRLTSMQNVSDWSDQDIDRVIKAVREAKARFSSLKWHTTGGIDLFAPGYVSWYVQKYVPKGRPCEAPDLKNHSLVNISGRQFKTLTSWEDHLRCFYGENWMEPPKGVQDWKKGI